MSFHLSEHRVRIIDRSVTIFDKPSQDARGPGYRHAQAVGEAPCRPIIREQAAAASSYRSD